MTTYIVFSTEDDAKAAEAQAVKNIRYFVSKYAPERLTIDGSLICFNAETKQLDPTAECTKRWAIPQQYIEGWAFPIPKETEIAPMPVELFMDKLDGVIVDSVTPLPFIEGHSQ